MALSDESAVVPQGGAPTELRVVARGFRGPARMTIEVIGLPEGVVVELVQPAEHARSATLVFSSSPTAAAGNYSAAVLVTVGTEAVSHPLGVVVAPVARVANTVDTALGVNGQLVEFLSTSFQPADWNWTFFREHPDLSPLQALGSPHIRVQVLDGSVPWKATGSPPQPTDWDFTELDAIVQPVLAVTDHSPQLQLAVAPSLPGLVDATGNLVPSAANFGRLAQYFANLVRYYNRGGFDWGGKHFQSPSPMPITWWGIFNEYNIHGLTPAQYVELYDAVVPAMLEVDPSLKLTALELIVSYDPAGNPQNHLPTFVQPPANGGVNAQVDAVATHLGPAPMERHFPRSFDPSHGLQGVGDVAPRVSLGVIASLLLT